MYCQIAVNFPKINSVLTYKLGEVKDVQVGSIVEVPLGKRFALGCVIEILENANVDKSIKYKELKSLSHEYFKLDKNELEIYRWASKYYMYSYGKLIFDSLPKYMKRIKDPEYKHGIAEEIPFKLNEDQKNVIDNISFEKFNQSLIHGVTGSGKSLIFLELTKRVLAKGKSVHYLLPEINLTSQFLDFFSKYLGVKIFSYHSSIKDSQKFNLWRWLKENKEPVLIIGVRSSIFLPVNNLGLIIIDEEHDKSFKQDDRCKFNARDIAIKKSQLLDIPVVLGSATPTLESFYRFKENEKLNYFSLKKRFNSSKLPEIEVIDCPTEDLETWPFSEKSISEIRGSLENNFQVLVFVNKLGYSKYIQCKGCGFSFECPNCDIRLTSFKSRSKLECYACSYEELIPKSCPECGCIDLLNQGFGTERVFNSLEKEFNNFKIKRFDRDELKKQEDVEKVLEEFRKKEIDILVGTQMIAKGHNFKNVDKIIILGIDNYLHIPDFRTNEKIYQQLVQVSGRAGRFGEDAKVIIQSDLKPSFFDYIKNHSFDEFYFSELDLREKLSFPPYSKIIHIEGRSNDESKLVRELSRLKIGIEKNIPDSFVRGPIPSIIKKIGNKYNYYLYLKDQRVNFNEDIKGVDLRFNVDP